MSSSRRLTPNIMIAGAVVGAVVVGTLIFSSNKRRAKREKHRALSSLLDYSSAGASANRQMVAHPPSRSAASPDGGDTIILTERLSSSSRNVPLLAKVAHDLRISLDAAERVLADPLPSGWRLCKICEVSHAADGKTALHDDVHALYYFNFTTGEASWDHPTLQSIRKGQTKEDVEDIKKEIESRRQLHKFDAKDEPDPSSSPSGTAGKGGRPKGVKSGSFDPTEDIASLAFAAFDTNKDGLLSKEEFLSGLSSSDAKSVAARRLMTELMGHTWNEKFEVSSLFSEIDDNGDGFLTVDEVKHWLRRLAATTDAHCAVFSARMVSDSDVKIERDLFEKHATAGSHKLELSKCGPVWKELSKALIGHPFTDSECQKMHFSALRAIAADGVHAHEHMTLDEFRLVNASGAMYYCIVKRLEQ